MKKTGMKKTGWLVLSTAVGLALFGTGTTAVHAQHTGLNAYGAPYQNPSADGRGEFPVGNDHHIGVFAFKVTLGHNGPEGSFEYNERNLHGQNVQHILVRPIDHLSIVGHTAQMEGPTLWHDRHARVRVIATDDGEHHDSLSIRVVAADGHDAGTVLYEAGGYLTSGAIHVH